MILFSGVAVTSFKLLASFFQTIRFPAARMSSCSSELSSALVTYELFCLILPPRSANRVTESKAELMAVPSISIIFSGVAVKTFSGAVQSQRFAAIKALLSSFRPLRARVERSALIEPAKRMPSSPSRHNKVPCRTFALSRFRRFSGVASKTSSWRLARAWIPRLFAAPTVTPSAISTVPP